LNFKISVSTNASLPGPDLPHDTLLKWPHTLSAPRPQQGLHALSIRPCTLQAT